MYFYHILFSMNMESLYEDVVHVCVLWCRMLLEKFIVTLHKHASLDLILSQLTL
jgi:hypothetical protein